MNEPHRARRGHDSWPAPKVLAAIPALYATEEVAAADKVVHLHYFVGGCDWWVVEVDSIERPHLAFGYVCQPTATRPHQTPRRHRHPAMSPQ
jgi:hypothetical protein